MRHYLFSVFTVFAFAVLYCLTALVVIILLIFAWLNIKRPICFISQQWAKLVFLIIGKKFPVYGKENIGNGENYILVANHASLFDIVAIMSFYPGVSWFGHERLLKIPVFSKILKMTDYVPFKEPTVKNTRQMIDQLVLKAQKQTVAIFPEGTRTLDGKINNFYKGFIYLFRSTEISILPITLNGFFNLKPKNRFFIDFRSRLEVIIHKPILREELIDKSDAEIIETVKAVIEAAYIQPDSLNAI